MFSRASASMQSPRGVSERVSEAGDQTGTLIMIDCRVRDGMSRTTSGRIASVVASLAACVMTSSSLPAQAPPTRSEELLRQWDLNRDGKVDTAEAELARAKMRRSRSDAVKNNDLDPATGRPRGGAATGRAAGGKGCSSAPPRPASGRF